VSRIRGRFRPERADGRKALWREVIEGMQLVWQHPLLRAVCFQAPLVNFAVTGVIFTITVALREHGTAPGIIGLTQAGVGAGGLLGAVAAPWMQGRMSLWRLVIALTVAASVLFALAALVLPSPLVAVPVAVTLFLAPTANAALFAAMLRSAPEDMRGRVSSSVILGAAGLAALSPLTAGLLVQHFSGRWAMLAFAATMALAAVMCITLPGLKETESAAGRASAAESEAAESEAAESEAAESEAAEPGAG
jgi:MFS family permease